MKKIIFLLLLVLSSQVSCTLTDPEVMEMLKALQAQNDKLLEEITKMKGQVSELDGKYQVILAGLADNKKDLEAFKGQVEALKTQISDQLKKIDQLTAQLTQQGADIVKLNAELAAVKASLADLLIKFDQLVYDQVSSRYPAGSVFGPSGPTIIVDVVNPKTGKTWMDRNLGASRAATSSTDTASYGDLYQWGRGADGHQLRNSASTITLSSSNQPGNGNFILFPGPPSDWRSPQNTNLWQGMAGINNPCPSGYRLPTETELDEERARWTSNNSAGAFASSLRLPMAGDRSGNGGSLIGVGTLGFYWSSTINSTNSLFLFFSSGNSFLSANARAFGASVRCIKD